MPIRSTSASLVLLLAACSGSDPVSAADDPLDVRLALSVPAAEYTRAASGSVGVPFRIDNRGTAAARVPRCGDRLAAELEREIDGRWTRVSNVFCTTQQPMDAALLSPGRALQGRVPISEPGRFRFRVAAGCDCNLRIGFDAVSNPFSVR